MMNKEKLKFWLNIIITPIIIIIMIIMAITMRETSILKKKDNTDSGQDILNVIDHTHTTIK